MGCAGVGRGRVATGLAAASPVLRSDRYTSNAPDDAFQNYHTLQDLASGVLTPERLVQRWREQLPSRGVQDDAIIDWLLWWDNALLWALRPQLPQGRLLVVLRDPRDMLLDWVAYGAAAPLAMTSLAEASEWLARALAQVAALHEDDLYPQVLLRIDQIGNDPQAMAELLGRLFERPMPPAAQLGAPRFPPGHWRNYRDVMSAASPSSPRSRCAWVTRKSEDTPMQLSSHSLTNGAPIDREFAAGDAAGFAPTAIRTWPGAMCRMAPVRSCWYASIRTCRPCRRRSAAPT